MGLDSEREAEKNLSPEEWYHGLLPREDIKMLLRKNGDFLVRSTEPKTGQKRAYVLSVQINQKQEEEGIRHYIILHPSAGKYTIEKLSFPSVSALVQHHMKSKESLIKGNNAILMKPILRQGWELNHEDVELTKKLGEGAFGEVRMGKLKLRKDKKVVSVVSVAVKLAKLEALTKEQIKEIMGEARLMRNFSHPNVVRFYGVAAGEEPLMVIMELASCGALDSYLQKTTQPIEKKNEMIVQAAWGIEYIHSKTVLHRDIAARNCLYGDGNVKISDFGLSREGTSYQMDPKKRVPIRWLAPETLRTAIYSQKTDVFSYGIMCWEIYSNGIAPYPGMPLGDVNVKVKDGYRMEMPANVNKDLCKLISTHCWPDNPSQRLTMPELVKQLHKIFPAIKPSQNNLSVKLPNWLRKPKSAPSDLPTDMTQKDTKMER